MRSSAERRKSEAPAEVRWKLDMAVTPAIDGAQAPTGGSRFCDDSWVLREVAGKATVTKGTLAFHSYPTVFRNTAKRIAWCMLNVAAPIALIERRNSTRTRLSVGSVCSHMESEIGPFIQWVWKKGVQTLSDVTVHLLRVYAEEVSTSALSRDYKARRLWGATRFWLYAPYLPTLDRLVRPPWEGDGTSDILGPAHWTGENRTHPIHPQTMSPLICWALKIVDEFSVSVLDAIVEKETLLTKMRLKVCDGDRERLKNFLDVLRLEGKGIPGFIDSKGLSVGSQYIALMANVGVNCIRTQVIKRLGEGAEVVKGCSLKTRPSLFLNDIPALVEFDFYDIEEYRQLLATACLVVIAYLSGMRSEECRGLTRGCCKEVAHSDGTCRYEISARSYKDALDADGNAIVGGRVRDEPWHVIAPVAKAISVMESLHKQENLFSKGAILATARQQKELALSSQDITGLIERFINWCNEFSQRAGAPEMHIPADPDGSISMVRFRRTLAWFIFRRPGGRISLGIQYGHLRGYTSDGYGSRTAAGLRDLFPMEEAFARAEALSLASEQLSRGEGVSGPSAERYLAGVRAFSAEYAGKYLTVRQLSQLGRDPALRIFDNGIQPLACCYDATRALCLQEKEQKTKITSTPDLTRCDSRCANVARTDSHIGCLQDEISWERKQADSKIVPEPLRIRHQQRAEKLEAIVLRHEQTRITIEDM